MKNLDELYRLYFRDVYLYLRSLTGSEHLAEELTAEALARALRGLDAFRGQCDVRVWLCQIAKNCWRNHCRSQGREVPTAPQAWPDAGCTIKQGLEDADLAARIHAYLHTMAEPYKEVFTLRVFCELPFAQIAALFGKTESWARVTYHRARLKIATWMEEQNHESTAL